MSLYIRRKVLPAIRKRGIVFVHVPRTGGKAITKALYGKLSLAHIRMCEYERWLDLDDYRVVSVYREECSRLRSAQRVLEEMGCTELLFRPPSYFVDYDRCDTVLRFTHLGEDFYKAFGFPL